LQGERSQLEGVRNSYRISIASDVTHISIFDYYEFLLNFLPEAPGKPNPIQHIYKEWNVAFFDCSFDITDFPVNRIDMIWELVSDSCGRLGKRCGWPGRMSQA
jgi:hypothetical protein